MKIDISGKIFEAKEIELQHSSLTRILIWPFGTLDVVFIFSYTEIDNYSDFVLEKIYVTNEEMREVCRKFRAIQNENLTGQILDAKMYGYKMFCFPKSALDIQKEGYYTDNGYLVCEMIFNDFASQFNNYATATLDFAKTILLHDFNHNFKDFILLNMHLFTTPIFFKLYGEMPNYQLIWPGDET